MTQVTVHRGPVVPDNLFVIGNLVEPTTGSGYVVLITDTQGGGSMFTGTVVVPDTGYHSQLGYVSDGFTKKAFKQFVGSINLKV